MKFDICPIVGVGKSGREKEEERGEKGGVNMAWKISDFQEGIVIGGLPDPSKHS